jgi:hypothetical protein
LSSEWELAKGPQLLEADLERFVDLLRRQRRPAARRARPGVDHHEITPDTMILCRPIVPTGIDRLHDRYQNAYGQR